MPLQRIQLKFERRLDFVQSHLLQHLHRMPEYPRSRRELCETEGLLSECWQVWCKFCRDVVVRSCLGSTRSGGVGVPATYASWEQVSFVAARQRNGVRPAAQGTNALLRKEPTWGDLDVVQDVVTALAPSNQAQLKHAFSLTPEIDHIRLIRNGAAHRNHQTLADVIAFQHRYRAFPATHPLQALYWIDPGNAQLLLKARMDDMRVVARAAVS